MATTVTFDGVAATSVTVTSETELTAVVPAGAVGSADVTVTTSGGSDTLTDGYTYLAAAPTITAIDPDDGPADGGNTVTITGTGFEI